MLSEHQVFTIPDLTVGQARVLAYHYEVGRTKRDRMVPFKTMIETLQERFGQAYWDEATKLRDKFEPPMLLFEDGKPLLSQHRLHETFFRDPKPLFEKINEAEQKAQVPLTPCPDVEGSVGVPMAQASAGSQPVKIGDIVQQDGQLVEVCRGANGIFLKPLAVVSEQDPRANNATPKTPSRPRGTRGRGTKTHTATVKPTAKPVPKAPNKPAPRRTRGHEVA